jgi:ABC-type antimicrobial peptide transport system permease subunit
LIERGGFLFVGSLAGTPATQANPWRLLDTPADGSAAAPIPVFAEQNSVMWMLKSSLGGVLEIPRDTGPPIHVHIAGILQDNPFQSELWMSEANFLRLFPGHEGYNVFLIETTPAQQAEAARLLETALSERGFDVGTTAERVAAYQAVVNTYLSTFQALGGLGLLLGALGLAVVLLRGVWERRGELALLRALGFRRSTLGWLVLVENVCLLLLGLGVGTLSALIAVAPHAAGGGQVPWLRLAGLLGLVLVVGLAAGAAALVNTLRAPLIPALRRE